MSHHRPRMSKLILSLALCCILALLPLGAEAAKKKKTKKKGLPWIEWQSEVGTDHVLAGRIWSSRHDIYLSPHELSDTLAKHDFVLLGEVHDNPDHHRLQAWLIGSIARHDRDPAVIMEMIDRSQTQALHDFFTQEKVNITELGKALNWEKSGWPEWKYYLPIARRARIHRLPIKAGSPGKKSIRAVSKKGADAISPRRAKRLQFTIPFQKKLNDALLVELRQSHCNYLPVEMMPNMARVQRYKDAVMADQMLQHGQTTGAVLIAGNGHVRNDRAVPWYIRNRDPEFLVATLMLLEVAEGELYPHNMVPKDPEGRPAADFVWFTPRNKRPDPCKELEKLMKSKHKKTGGN